MTQNWFNLSVEETKNNLKTDMTSKLEEKGYTAQHIEIETKTAESYTIEKISLKLEKVNEENKTANYQEQQEAQNVLPVNTIEEIQIQVGEGNSFVQNQQGEEQEDSSAEKTRNKLTSTQKKEIREYLSETYGVKEKNIEIK